MGMLDAIMLDRISYYTTGAHESGKFCSLYGFLNYR